MEFGKEQFKLLKNKSIFIFGLFIPGLVILEICFKKGLFSSGISNIYELFMLLMWSLILTIPFNYFIPIKVAFLGEDLTKIYVEQKGLKQEYEKEINEKEFFEEEQANLKLTFNIIRVIVLLIIYLILSNNFSIAFNPLKLNSDINHTIISFIGSLVIGYPIGITYSLIMRRSFAKIIKKRLKEKKKT